MELFTVTDNSVLSQEALLAWTLYIKLCPPFLPPFFLSFRDHLSSPPSMFRDGWEAVDRKNAFTSFSCPFVSVIYNVYFLIICLENAFDWNLIFLLCLPQASAHIPKACRSKKKRNQLKR